MAGARVAAIFDANGSAAAALSARHPGSRVVSALEEIRGMASVAHVCTTVETHATTATVLLDAGLHVLVEKPLAASPAETDLLMSRAMAAGRLVCPVHQFPFQRGVRQAVGALDAVGPVLHFDFIISTAGAATEADRSSLVETLLPHPLSLIEVFLPGSLTELRWRVLRPRAGELRAFSSSDSASVSILLSTRGRPTTNALTLLCERGTIAIDLFHAFCVVESGGVSKAKKIARPIVRSAATLSAATRNLVWRAARGQTAFPGLNELTALFYEAVAGGGASPISQSEILNVAAARQHILDASTN